jgi:hypothetical protein
LARQVDTLRIAALAGAEQGEFLREVAVTGDHDGGILTPSQPRGKSHAKMRLAR